MKQIKFSTAELLTEFVNNSEEIIISEIVAIVKDVSDGKWHLFYTV